MKKLIDSLNQNTKPNKKIDNSGNSETSEIIQKIGNINLKKEKTNRKRNFLDINDDIEMEKKN